MVLGKEYEKNGLKVKNRIVYQPMEGFDCESGAPTELTFRKYRRFAEGGPGIIWMEAAAVCEEGMSNARQMFLNEKNVDSYKKLVSEIKSSCQKKNGFEPLIILQATHSGRHSLVPVTAYPDSDVPAVNTEYLKTLPEKFYKFSALSDKAGFDGIDVKSCHGYLLAEFNSAYSRKDEYGGAFENRIRLFLECLEGANAGKDNQILTSRLGVYDGEAYPDGFGSDESGNIDLTEPIELIEIMNKRFKIPLLNITVGNPYKKPHINRPYRKGNYIPPEPPEKGVERFVEATGTLQKRFKDIAFVCSGLSYLRDGAVDCAARIIENGTAEFAGFGRMSLAYPDFAKDAIKYGRVQKNRCCVACSGCTLLMRKNKPSGCSVFDKEFYNL